MKKSNIFNGFASLALVFGAASCSSDYLDVQPISQESAYTITENVSKVRASAYAAFGSMYSQYSSLYDYMWFNGEPWFMMWYGEAMGNDFNSYFAARQTGYNWTNWNHMDAYNTWGDLIAWDYCYGIVAQCNNLLAMKSIVEEKGDMKGEMAFRFAQAYTLRAHAYIRLHQMYGPRWEDSFDGKRHSVIIRTEFTDPANSAQPLSNTNEVLDFIYDDLDNAIALYEASNYDRTYEWEADLSVAYGLYARAALLKNDWQTAEKKAHLASEGYEVMSAQDYKSGFNTPTSEWMWCSQEGPTGVYYASFGASWACNGAYPCIWGSYGAGAVDYTFYKLVNNANDVRCELFYTPDKEGRALRTRFWNADAVEESTMNLNQGEYFPAALQAFCDAKYKEIGEPNRWKFPYSGDYNNDDLEIGSTYIPFGAQFKFWGKDNYSSSQVCFMRASEMLLIEAEAACHNGNYSVAQDCLEKINKNRIAGYVKSTKTGDDLLAEVKLNRRWELWGEGFNWFDYKRWNEPISRDAWIAGDTQSGNWPDAYAKSFDLDVHYGWVWPIPQREVDYNDALVGNLDDPMYGIE